MILPKAVYSPDFMNVCHLFSPLTALYGDADSIPSFPPRDASYAYARRIFAEFDDMRLCMLREKLRSYHDRNPDVLKCLPTAVVHAFSDECEQRGIPDARRAERSVLCDDEHWDDLVDPSLHFQTKYIGAQHVKGTVEPVKTTVVSSTVATGRSADDEDAWRWTDALLNAAVNEYCW